MSTTVAEVLWAARPAMGVPHAPGDALGAVRWGVVHVPSGRWVAFGSEARCRRMVAHLTEVNAILGGDAPTFPRAGGPEV